MPYPSLRRRAGVIILFAAFVSFPLSATLWFMDSHESGSFVGLWVPRILSLVSVASRSAVTGLASLGLFLARVVITIPTATVVVALVFATAIHERAVKKRVGRSEPARTSLGRPR